MDPDHRALETGFEPFGDHDTNISQERCQRHAWNTKRSLSLTDRPLSIEVEVDVLTVDASGAQRTAQRIDRGERWMPSCTSVCASRAPVHAWSNLRTIG